MKGRITRKLSCSYIYTDGTLVQLFEEERNGIQIGETVDVTRGWCKLDIANYQTEHQRTAVPHGRIVIGRHNCAFVKLTRGARIEANLPSLANGSPNSQNRGLRVQNVMVRLKDGSQLWWSETPDILSGNFTVQESRKEEIKDEWNVGFTWAGSARIWKVTDLRPKGELAA